MKIQAITNVNNANYQTKRAGKNNIQPSFQSYVNGNYYKDEIIKEAKAAFNNPNWRDKFLAKKKSIGESLSTWHDRDDAGLAGRIIGAIGSFGLTEIGFGTICTLEDQAENREIDRTIKEIRDCIEDMKKSGGPFRY